MTTIATLPSWFRTPVGLLLVAWVSTGSTASFAQRLGSEVQVNVWTSNRQSEPSVGGAANGEFVVAWTSYAQVAGCYGYQGAYCDSVHARRISVAGDPIGDEIQVSTSTAVTQNSPAVARDAGGDFVVAWDSDVFLFAPGEVSARVFDPEGTAPAPAFLVSLVTGAQRDPAVGMAADGEFVVVWQHQSLNLLETGIFGRRFDAAGVPLSEQFAVRPATQNGPGAPTVAMSEGGSFVVAWTEGGARIRARRYDETGQPLGDSFEVSGADTAGGPVIAVDPSGGFVAAWSRRTSDQWDIAARRWDADGVPLGPEFQVNTHTTSHQTGAAVGIDGTGRFLVVWQSDSQDGSGSGIYGQAFDADAARIGTEFRVNAWTTGNQLRPAVAAAGPGHFLVAWDSQGQDGSNEAVISRVVELPQFADGFESGDTCAWSGTVGDGCL